LARAWPALADPRAQLVMHGIWPWEFVRVGLAAAAAALALRGRGLAPVAAVLAVAELAVVNARLNPTAPPDFYALQPPVRALVDGAARQGTARFFSYGVLSTPGLAWRPEVALANSDRALYSATRQSLVPITHELDGLEGAFDLDHMGWAPEGSTLTVQERTPARYRDVHRRLRLANVRWVLSFDPLPDDLVTLRGEAPLRETVPALRLYEVTDALPRAFWVPGAEVRPDRAAAWRRLEEATFDPRQAVVLEPPAVAPPAGDPPVGDASVGYRRLGPHDVLIEARTPPGYVVVLDGYHRHWRARGANGPVPLLRGNGRYWALPTPGGSQVFQVRYTPPWRSPALAACAFGCAMALALLLRPGGRRAAPLP
jgi:hypothetical protein